MNIAELSNKKIIIYGIGKYQRDFEFVFDMLAVAYRVIPSTGSPRENVDMPGEMPEKLLQEDGNAVCIIACDFNKPEVERTLNGLGFIYGQHWFYGEDFFPLLDYDVHAARRGRKIAVWGTGVDCDFFERQNNDLQEDIHCYIDKNEDKCLTARNGKKILHPDSIVYWDEYFIIVATVTYYEQIHVYLREKGLAEDTDYINYHKMMCINDVKPSLMMRKTVFDDEKDMQFCEKYYLNPKFEIMRGGYVIVCCWNEKHVGDVKCSSIHNIWHSIELKIFRLSLLNKTYSFCNMKMCKDILPGTDSAQEIRRMAAYSIPLKSYPKTILLAFDTRCNLFCITCREKGQNYFETYYENAIHTIVRRIQESNLFKKTDTFISVAHDGEALFCESYKSILFNNESFKRESIDILSNGILFTEDILEKLKYRYNNVSIGISIDAASENIYRIIRKGNFKKLLRILSMIAQERLSGFVTKFSVSMVVQKSNVHEMGDFVRFAENLHVDEIIFRDLHCTPAMEGGRFYQHSILHEDGSPKSELIAAFADAALDSPKVRMYPNLANLYRRYKTGAGISPPPPRYDAEKLEKFDSRMKCSPKYLPWKMQSAA